MIIDNLIYFLKRRSENIFIFFMSITAFVDTINGFLIYKYDYSNVGKFYRLALMFIFLVYLFIYYKDIDYKKLIITIGLYVLFDTLITFPFHNNINVLVQDLVTSSKVLLPIIIISTGTVLYKNRNINKYTIGKIMKINTVIVPFSLILFTVLKTGIASYLGDTGYMGYYYSMNEINIVMVILYIYVWNYFFINKKGGSKLLKIFRIVYVGIPLILIGSKTSLLLSILIPVIYIIRYIIQFKVQPKKLLLPIFFFVIIFIIFLYLFKNDISRIIARQIYMNNKFDFFTYIFSYRNINFINIWHKVKVNASIVNYFLGFRSGIIDGITSFLYIEFDFLNMFINYGLVGVFLVYYYYIKVLAKQWHIKDDNLFCYRFAAAIIFLFGMFAGHVLLSALSSTFLAIVLLPLIFKIVDDSKQIF